MMTMTSLQLLGTGIAAHYKLRFFRCSPAGNFELQEKKILLLSISLLNLILAEAVVAAKNDISS